MPVITEQAPAKLNLFLHITGRREDGYHLLQSLFAFSEKGDIISVEAARALSLEITGPFASCLQDQKAGRDQNIVMKAAYLLRERLGAPEMGANILLEKNLPVASGIGGGSSDAAAAIRALAKLWHIQAGETELADIALSLGADVPACLYAKPCLVEGIGEKITPLPHFPQAWCLLANPGIAVSTKAVFENFAQSACGFSPQRAVENFSAATGLKGILQETRNDLEIPARSLEQDIDRVLDVLNSLNNAAFVRMSGSGATCFALFEDEESMRRAGKYLKKSFPHWWIWPDKLAFTL